MNKKKKILILIPVYNSEETIGKVIENFSKFGYDICVINDGATDNTQSVIDKYKKVKKIIFEKNKGKGAGLIRGFEYFIENGYNACITVDADYQHLPKDLTRFVESYEKYGDGFIYLGDRSDEFHLMPSSNRTGNTLINRWLRLRYRKPVHDSQCGYRLYPAEVIKKIKVKAKRFGYETEFLIKAMKKKIEIKNVKVKAVYPDDLAEYKTHYKKFSDTVKIIWILAKELF